MMLNGDVKGNPSGGLGLTLTVAGEPPNLSQLNLVTDLAVNLYFETEFTKNLPPSKSNELPTRNIPGQKYSRMF